MRYLLDSNILIAVALATENAARQRLAALDEGDAVTSVIAYAEVLHGSRRGKSPSRALLATVIEEVAVLPFDQAAASAYADVGDLAEALAKELGSSILQGPWPCIADAHEPSGLILIYFIWRLLTWPIRGHLFDSPRYERLELGHVAAVIDHGGWFEP